MTICYFFPNQYQEEALPTIAENGLSGSDSRALQSRNSKNNQGRDGVSWPVNEMISYAIEKFLWTAICFRFNFVLLAPVCLH
jgi:hypothetical protein